MKISTNSPSSCAPDDPPQLLDRLERGDRLAIGVARGHHVVDVGDRDHPRERGDLGALQAPRIALPVDALVVGEDDVADRPVALDLRDDPRALVGVHPDDVPVVVGELRVALQDAVREDELADVVQQAGGVDEVLLLLREAGRDRDLARVARDGGAVASGHAVPQVERAQQRREHPDLEGRELLRARVSCLPRRSSSSARRSETSSWPSRYWKVNSTIPNSAIAAMPTRW